MVGTQGSDKKKPEENEDSHASEADQQTSTQDATITISNKPREADPLVPEDWKTGKTSNKRAYDHREDTTIILQTEDEFVLHDKINFSTTTLLVYAEVVRITSNCNFEGKTVGIFCNKLKLGAASTTVSLGVTGKKGDDVAPNQAIGDSAKGQNGGSLIVYIEELDDELIPQTDENLVQKGLFLNARGGRGGKGANMTSAAGGVGGDGGSGGIIQFYFGHAIFDEMNRLSALVDEKNCWWAKALLLSDFKFGTHVKGDELIKFAKAHAEVQKKLTEVQSSLEMLTLKHAPDHTTLLEAKNQLLDKLKSVLTITAEPKLIDSSEIASSTALFEKFRARSVSDTEPPWSALQPEFQKLSEKLSVLQTGLSPEASEFQKKLAAVNQAYQGFLEDAGSTCRAAYSLASSGGDGGVGGTSSSTELGNGASGKRGDRSKIQKSALVQPLAFTWPKADLNISTVFAHPDECQMLLNIADDRYFSTEQGGDMTLAQSLYHRLSKRLGFIEALIAKPEDGATIPALSKAYGELARKQLTFQPLVQLSAIKKHADRCLQQIEEKQDLFGHVSNWVPRLSYTFYQSRISELTKRIKALEEPLKKYKTDPSDAINKTISNAVSHAADSRDEVDLLTKGPLNSAAAQIDRFTPMLKTKKKLLQDLLSNAADGIKHSWNTDPKIFIDALCMTAMGHGLFNAGAQAASAGYKAYSTVHNAKGDDVEKKYVVSQFIDAGQTFEDLETAYRSRLDATIEVDDPTSAKLLAAEKDIKKLLTDFGDNIPEGSRQSIKIELALFNDIVKQRNDAVMLWNATINQLAKAREDQAYYENIAKIKAADLLQADADIPALIFWTRKAIDDLHYLAMQYLDFGRRSLNYWAIPEKKATSASSLTIQELFPQWQQIDGLADKLAERFTAGLNSYASNIGFTFPSIADRTQRPRPIGRQYNLSSEDIEKLKIRQGPPESEDKPETKHKGYYQVQVAISPPDATTGVDQSEFAKHCNVRLDQVHIWLFGAAVTKSTPLSISLRQLGTETITGQDYTPYEFMHDPIPLSFRYNSDGVTDISASTTTIVRDSQNFPNVFLGQGAKVETNSIANIGPFATWTITVSEQFNTGLDMKGLTGATLEFWGCAQEAA